MTGPQQPPYGGQGGQWPGGGGDWQSPSDQTQYSGPPGGGQSYDQPQSYEQYNQPQAYDQYGQQPGYSDQYSAPPGQPGQYSAPPGYSEPYSGPPSPYGDPNAPGMPPPPPAKQTNALPWILGGVAGVVVLVVLIIVAAVALSGTGNKGGGGSTGGGSNGGGSSSLKYSATKVQNACDLVDVDSLKKWASSSDKEPEHSENKNDYSSYLSCSASFKGGDYDRASMNFSANIGGEDSDVGSSYDSAKKSAEGQTGTGKEHGDVSGIGEKAFFSSWVSDSEYSSAVMYELGVLDGNLYFTVDINVFVGKEGGVKLNDVKSAAEDNAKKVLEELRS